MSRGRGREAELWAEVCTVISMGKARPGSASRLSIG